jgi:predicted Fe-Mo cluster-binding NifX family protein
VDIENNREIDRKEFYLDSLSLIERMTLLLRSGVSVVICGGVSDVMENMIIGKKIGLIGNITGDIEPVLKAYLGRRLGRPQFQRTGHYETSDN